jgi:hypothetical protein
MRMTPNITSVQAKNLPHSESGYMSPYPSVVIVTIEKYNAFPNEVEFSPAQVRTLKCRDI